MPSNITNEDLGFGTKPTTKKLILNSISMNGDSGEFKLKKFKEPKGEDGFYQEEKLEVNKLNGVIISIRRKLQLYSEKEGRTFSTGEFNKNSDEVTYHGLKGSEKMTVDELKTKYPDLKTIAVLYFYSPKKDDLFRIEPVKGLSFQDEENKGVNYKGLWQYLYSFGEEKPSDFITEVTAVQKSVTKGRTTKTYYALRFEQKELIEDESIKSRVLNLQKEVVNQFSKVEEVKKVEVSDTDKFVSDDIEYPKEDINVEDIPF